MIESSRFNNRQAWFVGDADTGDYYDQSTGRYLGSWSRNKGNFTKDDLTDQNLFALDVWIDRDKKPAQLVTQVIKKVADFVKPKSPETSESRLLPGKHIAVVGDSFAAHINHKHIAPFLRGPGTAGYRCPTSAPAWPSLVANALQINLAPYGFCARSWWYSWQKFWQDWQHRLPDLEAVVFAHTDCMRINHSQRDSVPNIIAERADEVYADIYQEEHVRAAQDYLVYIAEESFHRWCQRQFFRHIREVMSDIKMLHFFCFDKPSPDTCQVLPGMIFSTPLVTLSLSEIGVKPGQNSMADQRSNHFNDHNNRALAWTVHDALDRYSPGVYDIPWQDFQHANPKKYPKLLDEYLLNPAHHI